MTDDKRPAPNPPKPGTDESGQKGTEHREGGGGHRKPAKPPPTNREPPPGTPDDK